MVLYDSRLMFSRKVAQQFLSNSQHAKTSKPACLTPMSIPPAPENKDIAVNFIINF